VVVVDRVGWRALVKMKVNDGINNVLENCLLVAQLTASREVLCSI
jgi:hypothetical protein